MCFSIWLYSFNRFKKVNAGISEVEEMIFRDLILQIGGRFAFIHLNHNLLTDEEVRMIVG